MKTIVELASEAGFVSAQFWPDDFKGLQASVERFATLVEAAHTERLLAGVEMPESFEDLLDTYWDLAYSEGQSGESFGTQANGVLHKLRDYAAAAVAKNDKLTELVIDAAEIANNELKAENERLRGDAARYQWLTVNAYVGIAQHPKPHEVWCLRLPNPNNCNNLDAAIDAAMKGQP